MEKVPAYFRKKRQTLVFSQPQRAPRLSRMMIGRSLAI